MVVLLPFARCGTGDVNAAEKAAAGSSLETFLMTSILVGCLALGGFSIKAQREKNLRKKRKKPQEFDNTLFSLHFKSPFQKQRCWESSLLVLLLASLVLVFKQRDYCIEEKTEKSGIFST